ERLTVKSGIAVRSEVKHGAILNGAGLGNGTMIIGNAVSDVVIDGFHITKHTGAGIQLGGGGKNYYIINNMISDQIHERVQGHAIVVYGMRWQDGIFPMLTENVVVDGNTIRNVQTGVREAFNEALTLAWNIDGCKITNNVLDGTSMIGIDLIGKNHDDQWISPAMRGSGTPANPRRCIIANNTVLRAGTHGMDVAIYLDGAKDVLIEKNYMEGHRGHGIVASVEEHVFVTERVIIRNNVSVDGTRNMTPTATGQHSMSRHVRMAHNTVAVTDHDASGSGGRAISFYSGEDIKVLNNVFSIVKSSENVLMENYNDWAFGYTPILDGNCWNPAVGGFLQYKGVFYSNVADYQRGSGQDANAIAGDPQFVNIGARDFHLREGSPCRDSGVPLTTVASSGSGTAITLEDARWFTDGYDYWDNDDIQIGNQRAKVVKVDYNTNIVTLDRSLTWTAGTAVGYLHVGGPDRGAFEHGDIDTEPPPESDSPPMPPVLRTFK
ncbi:MAG: right-handed parallel beta-helix repeat-containing protein, partial [Woeseiaceae bacterium]